MVEQLIEEQYKNTKWWKDTQAWIKRIPQELDSKKGAKPLKSWKVFEADTWDAASAAAWDAAWTAAGDAARGAQGAAWDAAWTAAGDAARGAARGAAWDAAWDATLFARIKICAGLKIDAKHVKHAEERWEANKRGFRVWCDVNGVLYVYRKKP